jgi:hypothetical protein
VTSRSSGLSASLASWIAFSDQRDQIARAWEKYSFLEADVVSDNKPIQARQRARMSFRDPCNASSLPNV